jgi:glycosyltransferase involved in cell wall biosynthesis
VLRAALRPLSRFARISGAHVRGLRALVAGQAPTGRPSVWYGLYHVPKPDEPAIGGIIKLQHLVRRFPDHPIRFNVLYLVSSRLPDGPEALAKWARRKGAKIVLNQNGVAYPAWHGPGWERVNAPMSALLAMADYVFYQSEFCRESADRFARPAAGTHEVLYNPVDTTRFVPRQRPLASRPVTLLLGGSPDAWYRVDSAIRTLAALVSRGTNARLLITGRLRWMIDSAACRAQAERLLDELGLGERVELLGPYTQEQAPAIYQRADVLLHTKYNDPCPTVVIEALSSGLPVAYSASGGVPELVGAEAGVGVAVARSWDKDIPADPAALADAVESILGNHVRMSAAARQRAVDRFDTRRWLARHADVFEQLVTT